MANLWQYYLVYEILLAPTDTCLLPSDRFKLLGIITISKQCGFKILLLRAGLIHPEIYLLPFYHNDWWNWNTTFCPSMSNLCLLVEIFLCLMIHRFRCSHHCCSHCCGHCCCYCWGHWCSQCCSNQSSVFALFLLMGIHVTAWFFHEVIHNLVTERFLYILTFRFYIGLD